MFKKILIANRGEIAARVISTAHRLGIETVAVYSDADENALHVAMADEAVRVGPAPATQSYLNSDAILEAARITSAEAIHPGYGFLSEKPEFVDAVDDAGLVFVGPPAPAIAAMGLKDAAKALMEKAGVPVVPGYHGKSQDADHLAAEAERIGYPVLIKARAGGGGKGMRLVERPTDFAAALAGAQREGEASFGDPAVLVEKYVTTPRHVEIQVFADAHGNVVHMFERDCSLQRRHQKVIEEAPAPGMTEAVRAAMGNAAVEAARAIGYVGAGTVEFIADGTGPLRTDGFWFMEMNTRLQVEHPVTEAITGLDLVELQLRIAAGEPLPFGQSDLTINGHAFEARLYAEDAARGFLPATGRLTHFHTPAATSFARGAVRIDSGVRAGDEISPFYDPMIAKVIVHGNSRTQALDRLSGVLADIEMAGSVTNLEFLGALARDDDFRAGRVDTGLIARKHDQLVETMPAGEEAIALAALGALDLLNPAGADDPWDRLIGWRQWSFASLRVTVIAGADTHRRMVEVLGAGRFNVTGSDASLTIELRSVRTGEGRAIRLSAKCGDHITAAAVHRDGDRLTVFHAGRALAFTIPDPSAAADEAAAGGDSVFAPMPGLVSDVKVKAGSEVSSGDALVIMEAMKMQYTLTAPRSGVVEEVLVSAGDQIPEGILVARLKPEEEAETS